MPSSGATVMVAGLPQVARLARRRSLRVETIDGAPARTAPLAPVLAACGFRFELRGLAYDVTG